MPEPAHLPPDRKAEHLRIAARRDVVGTAGTTVARFSVVVTPTSGVVYGALQLTLTGGPSAGFTELLLFSPTLLVDVPYVRPDLSTGLRPQG